MDKLLRRFIIRITILTLALAVLGALAFYFFFVDYYFNAYPFVFLIFPGISVYIYSILLRTAAKKQEQFNINFMLSFLIKLVVYAAFVGIVLSADKTNHRVFVVFVLAAYLIYTVFDTKSIVKDIQMLNKKNQ